ncbi:MAG: hypothetical protein KF900_08185 [Bacteroidetes bacterium]|nr:hypothetical protein [Bacteroidota bacterium]
MAQFYDEYHTDENLQPLVGEISWTKHTLILNMCKDSQERRFYILSTKKFGWTKNVLIHQIENKTYERENNFRKVEQVFSIDFRYLQTAQPTTNQYFISSIIPNAQHYQCTGFHTINAF